MFDFDTFTKLPNNVSNLGKILIATGFECLPKKQIIAQSVHNNDIVLTDWRFIL